MVYLASIINKYHTILAKRLYVATAVPSVTQRHQWGIDVPGIPSDLIAFLGLCSPCDYRLFIEYPMGVATFISTEKALTLTICEYILRFRSKRGCSILILPSLI